MFFCNCSKFSFLSLFFSFFFFYINTIILPTFNFFILVLILPLHFFFVSSSLYKYFHLLYTSTLHVSYIPYYTTHSVLIFLFSSSSKTIYHSIGSLFKFKYTVILDICTFHLLYKLTPSLKHQNWGHTKAY